MAYAKERGKLEQLLTKLAGINIFNEKSLAILDDIQEKYSHTVRILKNKEPETFGDLYKNELQEIKACKKAVKESDSVETTEQTFVLYKESVLRAVEKTIKTTQDAI
jgi:hypothetical protein